MYVCRSETDSAIVKALKGSREPLRYNELHRRASNILGSRIWIKTFNDHLKSLCKDGEVIRKERNRYNVTYELARKHRDRERAIVELEKKLLESLLDFVTEPPRISRLQAKKLHFQKRIIRSFVKSLARRRFMVKRILSATLALAEGKEKEAQTMLDDYFFDYRLVLNHFTRLLSKIEGITEIANEMTEEWTQETEKCKQEVEGHFQDMKVFLQDLKAGKEVSDPYLPILNLAEAIENVF